MNKQTVWWGSFEIPLGATRYWRIGPLQMWVFRGEQEYLVHHTREEDPFDPRVELSLEAAPPPAEASVRRYTLGRTLPTLLLTPRCGDRPFLEKTNVALSVLAGEKLTFYVSTPAWLQLETSDGRQLTTLSSREPGSSWFGPNTREGELCYASATRALLDRAELELRPARLMTAVLVENHADSPLLIERLKLPVNHLDLYYGEQLWTQSVQVERRRDESIESRILPGPPGMAEEESFVSPAVLKQSDNLFRRTIGGLLA